MVDLLARQVLVMAKVFNPNARDGDVHQFTYVNNTERSRRCA